MFVVLFLLSNFCLSQTKVLFSLDTVSVYQSSKRLDMDETLNDNETLYYSDIDSYSLYELDLDKNYLSVYHNRSVSKYKILNKYVNSDIVILDVLEGDVISKYKIDLNGNSNFSMIYHYYDENQSMTFGTVTKKIKVLNCE
jgi:hypothetical protein